MRKMLNKMDLSKPPNLTDIRIKNLENPNPSYKTKNSVKDLENHDWLWEAVEKPFFSVFQ